MYVNRQPESDLQEGLAVNQVQGRRCLQLHPRPSTHLTTAFFVYDTDLYNDDLFVLAHLAIWVSGDIDLAHSSQISRIDEPSQSWWTIAERIELVA